MDNYKKCKGNYLTVEELIFFLEKCPKKARIVIDSDSYELFDDSGTYLTLTSGYTEEKDIYDEDKDESKMESVVVLYGN